MCLNVYNTFVELLPEDPVGAVGRVLELKCILKEGYFKKYSDGNASDIKCDMRHDNVTVEVVSNTTAICRMVPSESSYKSHYCRARFERNGQFVAIGCKFNNTIYKVIYIKCNYLK